MDFGTPSQLGSQLLTRMARNLRTKPLDPGGGLLVALARGVPLQRIRTKLISANGARKRTD